MVKNCVIYTLILVRGYSKGSFLISMVYKIRYTNSLNLLPKLMIQNSHWAVMSTVGCTKSIFHYYDSAFTTLSAETEVIISKLLNSNTNIEVKIMTISRQTGSSECGLYAIAIATAIAFALDPASFVFRQEDMRAHIVECFEKGKMSHFPVTKTRRHTSQVEKVITIFICPRCKKTDDGTQMVQCESCFNWYHGSCVSTSNYDEQENWYCDLCICI